MPNHPDSFIGDQYIKESRPNRKKLYFGDRSLVNVFLVVSHFMID